jgi:hypothetical protein
MHIIAVTTTKPGLRDAVLQGRLPLRPQHRVRR